MVLVILALSACTKDDPTDSWSDTPGKHSYLLKIDDEDRRLQVYVPTTYDGAPTPLVFMFHGSGGSGQSVFANSGWKEMAEMEGFIVIFPTALKYFVVELGEEQTKWSSFGLDRELEPGTPIIDDIPFVRRMIKEAREAYNIDDRRIYASGFSNGGGFCRSRLMTEMSDVFAAIGTAGGLGLPEFVPQVSPDLISLHTIMGNIDNKVQQRLMHAGPFPMCGSEIMGYPGLRHDIDNILEMLKLDSVFTEDQDLPHFNTIVFDENQSSYNNEYRILMVNQMGHVYPNGQNHASGLKAPEVFWEFFLQNPK